MFNKLEKIIKNIKGNVLTIGIDDKLVNVALKNESINLYSIFSNKNDNRIFKRKNKKDTNKGKTINIKKIRKYINKKSSNYIIINFDEVFEYSKYIIKDTIYVNNNTIYLYLSNDLRNIDKDTLIKRYKRYNVNIEVYEYKNSCLLKIDTSKAKNNWFKDKMYFIKDSLYNVAEFIGNLLIS